MQLPTFIRLENTLAEALKYYDSPQMKHFSFAGVQLLPNNPYDYTQRTYAADGIEIEDFAVLVKSMCGTTIGDITDYFEIKRNFQDPDTGLPQVEWAIKRECPLDAGYQMVCLEIQSGANGFTYSSPFMLTADNGEYVSDWYYRNDGPEATLLSTGLQFYFRQNKSLQEISNYTPISSGVPYTAATKRVLFERWNTDILEVNIIEELKSLFDCKELYSKPQNFDGLPVVTQLYEAIESPDVEADENFSETEVLLIRDYARTFNPNALPIIPPGPTPEDPFINLTSVQRIGFFTAKLTFNFGNFVPTYLTTEYSLDGITWVGQNTSTPTSPRTTSTSLNNYINNYYYRVIHQGTGTVSNVMQIPTALISIGSVGVIGLRKYSVSYALTGLTPEPGSYLEFQSSNDGTNWNKTITTYDNNNPKEIEVIESIPAMDRIRIKYRDIISNTFMLP